MHQSAKAAMMFVEGGVRVCIRAGDTGDDFGKANCVRNYVELTPAAPSITDRVSVPVPRQL